MGQETAHFDNPFMNSDEEAEESKGLLERNYLQSPNDVKFKE
jgi:hypothetical protein